MSMLRELTADDALDAVWGGSVLACGGGGWVRHGELVGELATRLGTPRMVSVEDLSDQATVVTVTAIGAPAAQNWEIRPVDYVRALERLIREVGEVAGVMTAQNGSSTTLNGWIQSAILDIPVLDAAGDVRAHPTGKLGALGLDGRDGYATIQTAYGGNRALAGTLDVVVRGRADTVDDVLRDVSIRSGGFIASARHPVEAAWVEQHAALGAISYALSLGAAMRAAAGAGGRAVIDAICDQTQGGVIARGALHLDQAVRTCGGWDHGQVRIGDVTVYFMNEHMAADRAGERIATYPDVITILSGETGRPIAVEDLRNDETAAVLVIPRGEIPLSSSTRSRPALAEVERVMGIPIIDPALN